MRFWITWDELMNKTAILVCLSLMGSTAALAKQTTVPKLTVKTLITHYSEQPGTPFQEQSADSIAKAQFADGYLAGVADSTQGNTWCDKGQVKPDEINSMVVAEFRKLQAKDQDKSAALAARLILETKFPCK